MAATTGRAGETCPCTRLRPRILLALNLPSLPFPGGCAGAALLRPPGREKAEEGMATTPLQAPGQRAVELEEATRTSHLILTIILIIGILLHDIELHTQVHIL